jgi:hypothetical protein
VEETATLIGFVQAPWMLAGDGWDGGEGVGGGRHESCEDQNYHAAG